jgi:CubicO group peptidase (beta-lactamase class C family)
LIVPAVDVVLMAELVRAPLIVLSILFFLLSVRGTKRQLMVRTGWLLFAIGGIVPLVLQVSSLPLLLLYITGQMSKHGIQGISLAVTSGTEIVYLKGYGTAGRRPPDDPADADVYRLAEQVFHRAGVAQLIEQGKIDPNDPVQKYIPWFRIMDDSASKKITVNHLLHHTSGLSEAGSPPCCRRDASNEDAVRALASAKLTAPVGVKHQYFNVGYDVLAVVVQNVSGMPMRTISRKTSSIPLEMTRTYTDPAPARENGLSQGYSRFFGFVVPQRQPHRVYEVSAGLSSPLQRIWPVMPSRWTTPESSAAAVQDGMDRLFARRAGLWHGLVRRKGHIYHGGANETFKTYVDIYPLRIEHRAADQPGLHVRPLHLS